MQSLASAAASVMDGLTWDTGYMIGRLAMQL